MEARWRDWVYWKPTEAVQVRRRTASTADLRRARLRYTLGWGTVAVACATAAGLMFSGVLDGAVGFALVGVAAALVAAYLGAWGFRFIR